MMSSFHAAIKQISVFFFLFRQLFLELPSLHWHRRKQTMRHCLHKHQSFFHYFVRARLPAPPPSRFVSSPPARVVTSPSLGCVNTEALMIEHIPITHDQPMTVTGTIVSPIHASVMITVTDVIAPARALALLPRLHKHLSLTCRGAADAHSSMSGARDYTGNEVYASIIILVIRQHLLADGVTQRRTVSLHSQAEKSVGVHPVEVPASKTRNQHQVIFTDVAVLAPSSLNFSPPQSRIPWKKARQLYILTSVGI